MEGKKIDKIFVIFGALGIVILGFAEYFLYKYIKEKKEKEISQKQKNERNFEIVR